VAYCDLRDSCFFFNELIFDMPHTSEYLRDHYCKGDFTKCALYRISSYYGKEKVPKYLYPNDMLEILNFNLANAYEYQGGTDMLIKVIHIDGSLGTVRSSSLGDLVKTGGIAAYQCSEGWIEVRRKQIKRLYIGPERRKTKPGIFSGV
jgi:hypothetical protein